MMHQILDNLLESSKELQFIDRNDQISLLYTLFVQPFLSEMCSILGDEFLGKNMPIEHSFLVEFDFLEKLFNAHNIIGDAAYVTQLLEML